MPYSGSYYSPIHFTNIVYEEIAQVFIDITLDTLLIEIPESIDVFLRLSVG